jgi:hypothetical protein
MEETKETIKSVRLRILQLLSYVNDSSYKVHFGEKTPGNLFKTFFKIFRKQIVAIRWQNRGWKSSTCSQRSKYLQYTLFTLY